MAAVSKDASEAGRALIRARWDSPKWQEIRRAAKSRKALDMLRDAPLNAAEAEEARALLPPVSGEPEQAAS